MVIVVYRKTKTSKKRYMTIFENEQTPDRIINLRSRKPLLPFKYIIDEMGIGERFVKEWKQKYKIKSHNAIK